MFERILPGHVQRGMHLLVRTLAVRLAENSAAATANMTARRLKRSGVKSKMYVLPPRRDRQWPNTVHADHNARSRTQGNRDDGPANPQSTCPLRFAIQAVAQSPAGGSASCYRPIETLEHANCTCRAEMAGSSRMAGLHDPMGA